MVQKKKLPVGFGEGRIYPLRALEATTSFRFLAKGRQYYAQIAMGAEIPRSDANGGFQLPPRLIEAVEPDIDTGEFTAGTGIGGIQTQSFFPMGDGFVGSALPEAHGTEIFVESGVARFQAERVFNDAPGFVDALMTQRDSGELRVGVDIVGFQRDGALILCHHFGFRPPRGLHCGGEQIPHGRVVLTDREAVLIQTDAILPYGNLFPGENKTPTDRADRDALGEDRGLTGGRSGRCQ